MQSLPRSIGRYEIVDQLGEGGMGILYLARDPLLGRTVAIKVLSLFTDELRERFAREARSAAALKHRHIVTVYDVGEDHKRPFIAMEYLDGETMAELIGRGPSLPLPRRLDLMLQLCSGLGYAHRAGIVHRDIKPANLMIETDGTLKILDFGLARVVSEASNGLTRAGAVLGTPHYMSPEQIDGGAIDHRSDIFSAGLVFYELITYTKAFTADSAHAVLHRIVNHPSPRLRDAIPGIDLELDAIVSRAIEKRPESRYPDLETMASEIDRVRARLLKSASDPTITVPRERLVEWLPQSRLQRGKAREDSGGAARTPRGASSLEAISRRREAEISSWLQKALHALQEQRYEEANEYCAQAALLDPHDSRVLELFERAHRGMDDARVSDMLVSARARIAAGALSDAEFLIRQCLELRPESEEARRVQQEAAATRADRQLVLERARAAHAALLRANASLEAGAREAALRSVNEALAHDSANVEAKELKKRLVALSASEETVWERVDGKGRQSQESKWDDRQMRPAHDTPPAVTPARRMQTSPGPSSRRPEISRSVVVVVAAVMILAVAAAVSLYWSESVHTDARADLTLSAPSVPGNEAVAPEASAQSGRPHADTPQPKMAEPVAPITPSSVPLARPQRNTTAADPQPNGLEIDAQLERGTEALDAGNYEVAIAAFKKVLSVSPRDPRAQQGLQQAQHASQAEKAVATTQQVTTMISRAKELHDNAEYEKEIELLGKAQTLDPGNPVVKHALEVARKARDAEAKLRKRTEEPLS